MSHRSVDAMSARSRCAPVVIEQSTEALLTMNATASGSWWTLNQGVLETLMVPLAVVVRNKLGHRSSEVPFAQQNHPVETLLLDRTHKPGRAGDGRFTGGTHASAAVRVIMRGSVLRSRR